MKAIKKVKTRAEFNNGFLGTSMLTRLKNANVTDLRDNFKVEHLKNGYSRVTPIDPTKKY